MSYGIPAEASDIPDGFGVSGAPKRQPFGKAAIRGRRPRVPRTAPGAAAPAPGRWAHIAKVNRNESRVTAFLAFHRTAHPGGDAPTLNESGLVNAGGSGADATAGIVAGRETGTHAGSPPLAGCLAIRGRDVREAPGVVRPPRRPDAAATARP
jgi:hypothetical protein